MMIETLVAALGQNPESLPQKMNLEGQAIVVNQCGEYSYKEINKENLHVNWFNTKERGVGLNRNTSLMRASGDYVVFSDEDIEYRKGYTEILKQAIYSHKETDMLLFNIEVDESRRTYFIKKEEKVGLHNCGRYPAYSFCCRLGKLRSLNITYNQLFGGGCKYSNGEDSLFIQECIKKGMKVKAVPITLGREIPRESTWFKGYNDKFFVDRGVLYAYMYGKLALLMAFRFGLKTREKSSYSIGKIMKLMKSGIDTGFRELGK